MPLIVQDRGRTSTIYRYYGHCKYSLDWASENEEVLFSVEGTKASPFNVSRSSTYLESSSCRQSATQEVQLTHQTAEGTGHGLQWALAAVGSSAHVGYGGISPCWWAPAALPGLAWDDGPCGWCEGEENMLRGWGPWGMLDPMHPFIHRSLCAQRLSVFPGD